MNQPGFEQARILIVDDQEPNVVLLERLLREMGGYSNVRATTDPLEVFGLYAELDPDLILLDLVMPGLDGFGVMEQLGLVVPPETYLPILVLTADITTQAKQRALASGAHDFLTKPFDAVEVLLRIRNLLETRQLHLHMEQKVRERTEALEEAQAEILERLAASGEYRDDHTGQHTRRVAATSARIARAIGLPEPEVQLIARAAPLHDLGKIGIPDTILLKEGRITPEEYEKMKTHTTIGASILDQGRSPMVRMAEEIALTHHEHWDGSGYPRGLRGEAIPLAGRIVAIADVFDALTSRRPYKQPWPPEAALAEINFQSGRQFDPRLVEAFTKVVGPEIEKGQASGLVGAEL